MDTFLTFIAILILPLAGMSIWSAWKLYYLSRSPDGKGVTALRERADVAAVLAVSSAFTAILALNRISDVTRGESLIPDWLTLLALIIVVIATSIPGSIWLWRWRNHRF